MLHYGFLTRSTLLFPHYPMEARTPPFCKTLQHFGYVLAPEVIFLQYLTTLLLHFGVKSAHLTTLWHHFLWQWTLLLCKMKISYPMEARTPLVGNLYFLQYLTTLLLHFGVKSEHLTTLWQHFLWDPPWFFKILP